MNRQARRVGALVALILLAGVNVRAAGGGGAAVARALPDAEPPRFGDAVAEILTARCVRCHGPEKAENALRLDSYVAVMRGGESGPAVVPSDPRGSLLLLKVRGRDLPAMPPKVRLKAAEIAAIRSWIAAGALP